MNLHRPGTSVSRSLALRASQTALPVSPVTLHCAPSTSPRLTLVTTLPGGVILSPQHRASPA